MKRLFLGFIISAALVLLPLAGQPAMLGAWQIWGLIIFGTVASFLQPGYNPFTIARSPGDAGTGAGIIWTVYITQVAALCEAAYLRHPDCLRWDAVAGIAVGMAVLGLALRTWAVWTLGRFFTMHLAVHADQRVIRHGPYAIVRHPSYLGAYLIYVATGMFLHAWYAAGAAAILLLLAFVRRIRREDALLTETLGAEYATYRQQVKALIPGIW